MKRTGTFLLLLVATSLSACDDEPAVAAASGGSGGGGAGGVEADAGGGAGGVAPGCEGPELCNGLDDDCDQAIDEDAAEAGAACGDTEGACLAGIIICRGGEPVCTGATGPATETCNGIDDDCDGEIDNAPEGVGEACGVCAGLTACVDGALRCEGGDAQPEVCNGLDDDCDGQVDETPEGVGQPCGGVGECAPGVLACVDGAPVCEGAGEPGPEICNGADDDCDGQVDEEAARTGEACDAGACGLGVFVCAEGRLGCAAEPGNGSDEVCDGQDNDCDGAVDESDPQAGMRCGTDVGACEFGELSCVAGTILCLGGLPPVAEACDQRDNDCDGQTDEADDTRGGVPCPGIGEHCEVNRNCATGTCFSDYGTRYCTEECDPAAPVCPDGLTCEARGPFTVCTQSYGACISDAACDDGEACMITPASTPDMFGGQCRPRFADGLPANADCGEGVEQRCASGLCMAGPDVCSSLCQTAPECPDGQVCAATPFTLGNGERLDLGLCLSACTRDAQCADDGRVVCQYGRQADGARIIGYCDLPYAGAEVGEACDPLANPPQTCNHGFCNFRDGAGYCSSGCVTAEDCLPGWLCVERPYGRDFRIGLCEPPN